MTPPGKPSCTYPSGSVPSFTTKATITLSNVSSATQNTDATITLSGTAVQGKDYAISPAVVTWAPGTSGSKDVTITIYDDNVNESDETIVLGYTLNANGGTAVAGSFNQTETITISDDDTLASTYMYDKVLGDFDTYASSASSVSLFRGSTSRKKIQYFYSANEMRLAGLKAGYISHLFLYTVGTATTTTFTNLNITVGTTAASNLNSAFATFTSSSSAYSGNYTTPTTEDFFDFPLATPLYWDGNSNIVVQACYDGASGTTNYLTAVSPTGSTNICTRYLTATSGASLCGNTGGTTATTRADIAFGMYNAVQSTINLSRTAYLGPNADVSFYSASDGKLMARIVNNSSFDYGCTQVLVDRAGTSASQFWRTGVANYLTDKTFRVLPTNDNPTGSYDIYLYYSKAEHDGWETTTGKDWETLARIVKVKSHDISEVTPSTTSYFSSVDIPATATRNVFGADYEIKASFATGFSGFAAGDPSTVPLPIKLLSFTGTKLNATSVLNWVTSFEYNNDHFEIEVSTNGSDYHSIGTVASQGNSNIEQKYSFTDRLPVNGINYYRLKQVDKDGTITYSNIITLHFNLDKYIAVYPNPVKDALTVTLGKPSANVLVQVIAADGKLVYNKTLSAVTRVLNIDVHALPQGTYMLQLVIDGDKQGRQFVKE